MSSSNSSNPQSNKEPRYSDYLSLNTLDSMFRSITSVSYTDYRVVATVLHLIIEICLKKLAILNGIEVSTRSHHVNGLLFKLSRCDFVVDEITTHLKGSKKLRGLQQFPYDELRFNEVLTEPLILTLEDLSSVADKLLARLSYIETTFSHQCL